MSNIIPMVSSSPPPLEDGGGFDDWDEDFGNFMGADSTPSVPGLQEKQDDGNWWGQDSVATPQEQDSFADFGNFQNDDSSTFLQSDKSLNSQNCSDSVTLNLKLEKPVSFKNNSVIQKDFESSKTELISDGIDLVNSKSEELEMDKYTKQENGENTSRNSMVDSGLCSSDISPVPKSEDISDSYDKSQESVDDDDDYDAFSDFQSGKVTSQNEIVSQVPVLKGEPVIENETLCNSEKTEDNYTENKNIEKSKNEQNIDFVQISNVSHKENSLQDNCSSQEKVPGLTMSCDECCEHEDLCKSLESDNLKSQIPPSNSHIQEDNSNVENLTETSHIPSENTDYRVDQIYENDKNCINNPNGKQKSQNNNVDLSRQDDSTSSKDQSESLTQDPSISSECNNETDNSENTNTSSEDRTSNKSENSADQTQSDRTFICDRVNNDDKSIEDHQTLNNIQGHHIIQGHKDNEDHYNDANYTCKTHSSRIEVNKEKSKSDKMADSESDTDCNSEKNASTEVKDCQKSETNLVPNENLSDENNVGDSIEFKSLQQETNEINNDGATIFSSGHDESFDNDNDEKFDLQCDSLDFNTFQKNSVEQNVLEVPVDCNDITDSRSTPEKDMVASDSEDFADFSTAPQNEVSKSDSEDFSAAPEKEMPVSDSDDFDSFSAAPVEKLPKNDTDDFASFSAAQKDEESAGDDFADFSESTKTEMCLNDSDEFANFSEAPQGEKTVGETDEFSDFNSATSGQEATAVQADFGNFADFSSATEDKDGETQSFTSSFNENFAAFQDSADSLNDDGDDWATFQEPSPSSYQELDDQDDDFGDFSDTNAGEECIDKKIPKPDKTVKQKELTAKLVDGCFPNQETLGVQEQSTGLLENIIKTEVDAAELSSTSLKNNLPSMFWCKLKKLDSTQSLKWNDSSCNKKLFYSLRIDTRNILLGRKKQSVPIYAANLTMLEPTKGPLKPVSAKPEVTLVDTNKTEEPPPATYQSQSSRPPAQNKTTKSSDIPPVQFDWTSSGLTNPLESNSKTLNLDFLVMQENEAAVKNGVFESELMHGQKASLQPLENILANLKATTVKRSRQTESLGEEASRVMNSLPDLSFMQAKVLMFPLRQMTDP